jgi:hypothetical protein
VPYRSSATLIASVGAPIFSSSYRGREETTAASLISPGRRGLTGRIE